ncbi:hypothetical protein ABT189_11640 [Streptomyces sp900105755]|uniref:hypothetical protein n=1 Tax=Streptomyces sp. 900105755 TaxID=3154389 RepID=UPI003331C9F5
MTGAILYFLEGGGDSANPGKHRQLPEVVEVMGIMTAGRRRRRPLTPLSAVVDGVLAGVAGTVCMDATRYLRYRRTGGTDSPKDWEFAPVEDWEEAPDPGKVAKRLLEGFTQREVPDRWAWVLSTAMHWSYGSAWGALYGIAAGSVRRPNPLLGLPFGAAVCASAYLVLPQAGLYQQVWKYSPKTLADDLSAHLVFGLGAGTCFWLISRH